MNLKFFNKLSYKSFLLILINVMHPCWIKVLISLKKIFPTLMVVKAYSLTLEIKIIYEFLYQLNFKWMCWIKEPTSVKHIWKPENKIRTLTALLFGVECHQSPAVAPLLSCRTSPALVCAEPVPHQALLHHYHPPKLSCTKHTQYIRKTAYENLQFLKVA